MKVYIDDKLRELKRTLKRNDILVKEVFIKEKDYDDLLEYIAYFGKCIKKKHINFLGFKIKKQ